MQNRSYTVTRSLMAGLAIITLAACDSGATLEGAFAELGIDTTQITPTESGLYIDVIEEGVGDPAVEGDATMILYSVWLTDGELMDSSYNSDPPRPFPVVMGGGGAIEGFSEGTAGMRIGEKRRLVVPPELGYGPGGNGAIPGNATLIFEVEAQDVQSPATATSVEYTEELGVDLASMTASETGLYWTTLEEGTGEPAVDGDVLKILYSGWLADGTLFDSSYNSDPPRSFDITMGGQGAIPGFMEGTRGMRVGEKRRLVIPPSLGYGWGGRGLLVPNSVLVFEVERAPN